MHSTRSFPWEVQQAAVRRYLTSDISYRELSLQVGASAWTLRGWVKRHQSGAMTKPKPGARSTEQRTPSEKLQLLLKAQRLPDDELGEFLRREGLREGDLERFEQEALEAMQGAHAQREPRKQLAEVERRAQKAEKRLREANALLALQKKVQALWADEDDDTPRS